MEKCEEAKHSPPRRAAEDALVTAQHDVPRWARGRWRPAAIRLRGWVAVGCRRQRAQRPSKHNAALGMRPEHRHMETQPRHAAAQVTLLEASFVFLPGLRRGGNPSSEQHRQAPKHKCCCRFARSSSGAAARQRSSRAACSSSSGAACSNSSGAACSNSGGAIERRYRQRSLAYCSQRRVVSTCVRW